MYVHPENNPGNIEYNSSLLVFVKSWFIPVESGGTSEDRWLRIPAIKTEGLSGQDVYTPLNINVETVASMILTEEGKVRKAPSVPVGTQMPKVEFDAIQKDVFDIGEWETTTKQPWPYRAMFDGKMVRERYQAKHGNNIAPFGSVLSESSISYNNARAAVMSRPCNCGKK
jgi:hypothetical protein